MRCDIPPRPVLTPAGRRPIIEAMTGFALAGVACMCACCMCAGAAGRPEDVG